MRGRVLIPLCPHPVEDLCDCRAVPICTLCGTDRSCDSCLVLAVVDWLERNGVTVHLYAHQLPCAGLYRSETREIFVNEPTALGALATLAHETGHWLGYLINERPHSCQRERQAFVYGWWVVQQFGLPISREEWIRLEVERRDSPSVQTEHLYRRD